MVQKKKKISGLIAGNQAFERFLNKNYGYTDFQMFVTSSSFSPTTNELFRAKNASGDDVFIKKCRYVDMCENEYKRGMELWAEAPDNFAKPLAYYAGNKRFSFSCNEYLVGRSFEELFNEETVFTPEQKAQIVDDVYAIHLALRNTNIAHRDIEWKNLFYHNGRTMLLDCQLSTKRDSKDNVHYYRDITRVCKMRKKFPLSMSILEWDDTARLLEFVQKIGTDEKYKQRYDFICAEMSAAVGKYKYVYPYPSVAELNRHIKLFRVKSLLHFKAKRRENSRKICSMLQFFRKNHPDLKR